MYCTIVYDDKSGHSNSIFVDGYGKNKMHNSLL